MYSVSGYSDDYDNCKKNYNEKLNLSLEITLAQPDFVEALREYTLYAQQCCQLLARIFGQNNQKSAASEQTSAAHDIFTKDKIIAYWLRGIKPPFCPMLWEFN
jgi:hypothetical protein